VSEFVIPPQKVDKSCGATLSTPTLQPQFY